MRGAPTEFRIGMQDGGFVLHRKEGPGSDFVPVAPPRSSPGTLSAQGVVDGVRAAQVLHGLPNVRLWLADGPIPPALLEIHARLRACPSCWAESEQIGPGTYRCPTPTCAHHRLAAAGRGHVPVALHEGGEVR